MDHSASEKRSPLSNHDTLLVWTGKQWGSLSFFFHVLTTHNLLCKLCHPAAPAVLQHLTTIVINFWELCNAE